MLLSTGLLIVGIAILAAVHLFGHLLAAKIFGIRIKPPSLSLRSMMSGLIAQDDFQAKPIWQRMIIILGGIIMNVVFAILVFSILKIGTVETFIPISAINKSGILVLENSIGERLGLKTGDKMISVNGQTFPYYKDYQNRSFLQQVGYYEVERAGQKMKVEIPSTAINFLSGDDPNFVYSIFEPLVPCMIKLEDELAKHGPAAKAGLHPGDIITRIDEKKIESFLTLYFYLQDRRMAEMPRDVQVEYIRNGQLDTARVQLSEDSKIGVGSLNAQVYFKNEIVQKKYGLLGSIIYGTKEAFGIANDQVIGLGRLADSEVESSRIVKGPLQISVLIADVFLKDGIKGFFRITAVLSMILALVNFIPLPQFDAWHLLFLFYEAITHQAPSVRAKRIAKRIVIGAILCLMLFVLLNDAFQLILG